MGTILGINYTGVFFLICLVVILWIIIWFMNKIRKECLKAGYDNTEIFRDREFLLWFGLFLFGFFDFNCLVYRLMIEKEVPQRVCIAGDVYIMDSFDDKFHIDDNYNLNYEYSPINSNEETVTIDNKIYEIITPPIYEDIFNRTVVDGITGWNIYKHTGNIVNGKIISLEYLENQAGRGCK